MDINVKKTCKDAKLPTRGSEYAAGYDLYACILPSICVPSGSTVRIGTGIALEIPDGYFGGIYARSGLATKKGLRPANCVGIIDSDYRGEVVVSLHNDSNEEQIITPNERIAQLIIQPYENVEFNEVSELNETVRGNGGFGSTGTM